MKPNTFTFAVFGLMLLAVSGWASDKMKATLEIPQSVHIGESELAPGEYKMTWTQSGSSAEVTIYQHNKVIATVPARVAQVRSGYQGPALHINNATNRLTEVELPKVSISFTGESDAVPSSSE